MLNKILTKLQEKYKNSSLFQEGGFLAPDTQEEVKKIKLPIIKLMCTPFNQILDHAKVFFILTIPAAAIISLFSDIIGFNYLCIYPQIDKTLINCSNSVWGYMLYCLIKIFVIGYVGLKWSEIIYGESSLSRETLKKFDKKYINFCLFILGFYMLNMTPFLSAWLLYMRTPNPNWQIELIFFSFASLGFILPFLLLRIYAILGFVLRGQKIPSLKNVWQKTSGNMVPILFSVMIIFIMSLFIFGNLYSNFKPLISDIRFYTKFISEFIYTIFVQFIFLVFLNNINLQYQIFYESSTEDKK